VIPGYELAGPLGRGAGGVVYLGRRAEDGSTVALKHVANGNADARAVSRLRREAAALADIDHAGVVRIVEVVDDGDDLWLVMEHVPGATLGALRPLTRPAALCAVAQLAAALDAVHRRGIVHRDVKPSNVIVDPQGRCRLVDFGIARFLAESQHARLGGGLRTDTGTVLGTPRYLAPELLGARPTGPACDIYGLAVVAYELVVGRVPFDDDDVVVLLDAHRHRTPPDPATLDPSLAGPLAAALVGGLAKEPDARSPTAAAWWQSLADAADAAGIDWRGRGSDELTAAARVARTASHGVDTSGESDAETRTEHTEHNTRTEARLALPRARLPVFRGHRRRRVVLGTLAFAIASLAGYVLVRIF
jgi:serine/threonine protein kinase